MAAKRDVAIKRERRMLTNYHTDIMDNTKNTTLATHTSYVTLHEKTKHNVPDINLGYTPK